MNTLSILSEAARQTDDKLKHLEHPEDRHFDSGEEGYTHSMRSLHATHAILKGEPSKAHVSTKFDGSPSLVFGYHPDNGKFFVATKSAFNVEPKINQSNEDIERNHGHAPGLVEKLKQALKHMPKVTPNPGVYQGDVMHSGDAELKDNKYHFKPNTITYTADKDSEEGKKLAKSKFGVVVHTKYKGRSFDSMKAAPATDLNRFGEHPDVHLINPVIQTEEKRLISSRKSNEFDSHMQKAEEVHQKLIGNGYATVQRHANHLKMYVNHTVTSGEEPSVDGYKKYMTKRGEAGIAKMKSARGKASREAAHNLSMSRIENDKEHLANALELHKHLQNAKHVLVNAIEPTISKQFGTQINGKKSKSEGSVVTHHGGMIKLVDRQEFSKANFQARPRGSMTEEAEKHGVLSYMRANPVTPGHVKVAEKVRALATLHNADHRVVLSHSQDAKKNPLSAEQKVEHAKAAFPEKTNVEASSKSAPTLLHHAAAMHAKGVQHLHVVAGSDRVEEFHNLLHKYNDGKQYAHGSYKFKSITVHSSGQRDPDAEGVSGISATKMRNFASSGDRESFHTNAPHRMSDSQKHQMYNDVRKGMGIE